MHARGKRSDGKLRGMAAGARSVLACACSRARVVPSQVELDNFYRLGRSYKWNQIILQAG
jgi:hypothetical protein